MSIETHYIFENNIEKGCLITLGKEYNNLKINQDFNCYIHDYIYINKKSNRPHNL
jgi:hypothetical protein